MRRRKTGSEGEIRERGMREGAGHEVEEERGRSDVRRGRRRIDRR